MKLQTPVADAQCKVSISYKDKITMIGSCFSDNVGKSLSNYGFDVCVNPFGTLYNPVSILRSIERLISARAFTEDDCVQIGAGDERYCSFSHHTSFARAGKEEFLDNANQALQKASRYFAESTKVIITLGTSWCFRNTSSGQIVSNCLKRHPAEFVRERLSAQETADCLKKIMELCRNAESDTFRPKEFIFTVSPIRHFKDGAHGNQISKAGLLLGIEEILGLELIGRDFVLEAEGDAGIDHGLPLHDIQIVFHGDVDVGKDLQIGLPAEGGAGLFALVGGLLFQTADVLALFKVEGVFKAVAPDGGVEELGGILGGAGAQTVQAQRVLVVVALTAVLAAGVQLAEDQLPVILLLLLVPVHGTAAALVLHLNGVVGKAGDGDEIAVTLTGLINGVGHDLEYGVLTALQTVRAKNNARTLADAVCALQCGDGFVAVTGFLSHSYLPRVSNCK